MFPIRSVLVWWTEAGYPLPPFPIFCRKQERTKTKNKPKNRPDKRNKKKGNTGRKRSSKELQKLNNALKRSPGRGSCNTSGCKRIRPRPTKAGPIRFFPPPPGAWRWDATSATQPHTPEGGKYYFFVSIPHTHTHTTCTTHQNRIPKKKNDGNTQQHNITTRNKTRPQPPTT